MARSAFALLAVVYVILGIVWTVVNLGAVPHYFDTADYLKLAQTLRVDAYRGLLCPFLLRVANQVFSSPTLLYAFPEPHPRWLMGVQIIQCLLSLGAFAYFAAVVIGRGDRAGWRRTFGSRAALVLLLGVDPLISHFNLSIMPDSLALAASLTFCAALAELAWRRDRVWIRFCILGGAYIVAASLRPEKRLVLLLTALSVVALWFWGDRRAVLRRRALVVLLVVGAGWGGVSAAQRLRYQDYGRWPVGARILHQRVIFPNLSAVYDDLAPRTRALLTRADAELYDSRDPNTTIFAVIDRVTHNDAALRDQLTTDVTAVVLRQRWPQVASNILRATLENLLATGSFYSRLLIWQVTGADPRAYTFRFEATAWTYFILAQHHPWLSAVFVWSGAAVFLCALPAAFLSARDAFRLRAWRSDGMLMRCVPAAVFCGWNALAFAATAGVIHIRYAIASHAIGLLLVYTGALCWLFQESESASR